MRLAGRARPARWHGPVRPPGHRSPARPLPPGRYALGSWRPGALRVAPRGGAGSSPWPARLATLRRHLDCLYAGPLHGPALWTLQWLLRLDSLGDLWSCRAPGRGHGTLSRVSVTTA